MKKSPKKRYNDTKIKTPESRNVGNYGRTIYNENQDIDQSVEEEKKQDKAIDEDGGQKEDKEEVNKDADGGPFLTCDILNPNNDNDDNDADGRLSDVGSDVDSVSKDQYLQACKLLKSTLIDKERTLAPSEREFLLNLVKDFGTEEEGGGGIGGSLIQNNDNKSSAIENNKASLPTNDSKVNYKRNKKPAPAMSTPPPVEVTRKEQSTTTTTFSKSEIPKNPHTSTRTKRHQQQKKSKFNMSSVSCAPKLHKDENQADIVLMVNDSNDFDGIGFDQQAHRRRRGEEETELPDGDADSGSKLLTNSEPKKKRSTLNVEKDKTLAQSERDFILGLVKDFGTSDLNNGGGSEISKDQITAIENITRRLDNNNNKNDQKLKQKEKSTTIPFQSDIPKNPHTATQKRSRQPAFNLPTIPCGPRSMKEVETTADIVMVVNEEDDFDEAGLGQQETAESDSDHLVRFDGWAQQRSMEFPFRILGADGDNLEPRVLTPSMMEAFRGFLPYAITESNFWLKFSLARDGASLATLLATIRASTYTIIGVETLNGEVFGSFTGVPWITGTKWYGNGEAFLWRLKKSRITSSKNSNQSDYENEMEVYPFTGYDYLVQYCTSKTIAIGGGDWVDHSCPFDDEPKGIGLMIDGDLAGGETSSCATFANPPLCKTNTSNEFSIANLEVWTLTPFENEYDAAQLEIQKLYMEENSR